VGEFIYSLFKDIFLFIVRHVLKRANPDEVGDVKDETITFKWFRESGLENRLQDKGYQLLWAESSKVKEKELKGYKVFIDDENGKKKRYHINTLILMVKD